MPVPEPNFSQPRKLAMLSTFGLDCTHRGLLSSAIQTNLAQTSWINLGGVTAATANPMTLSDIYGPGLRRFYRVVLSP